MELVTDRGSNDRSWIEQWIERGIVVDAAAVSTKIS